MTGETMLRVGNSYPQTAYLYIQSDLSEDADDLLYRLSEEHGFDAEIL